VGEGQGFPLTKLNSLRFGAARTESRAPSGQKPRKICSNLYKICMQDIFLRKPCMKALCVHDEQYLGSTGIVGLACLVGATVKFLSAI
jgi:hypothetical protein